MTLEQLLSGLGAAQLTTPLSVDGQAEISAARARRMARAAGIIPAVLGDASEVLDLGWARRFPSPAIRRALPWAQGGHTNPEDATLLCGFHHHRIHDPGTATDDCPTAPSGSTGEAETRTGERPWRRKNSGNHPRTHPRTHPSPPKRHFQPVKDH